MRVLACVVEMCVCVLACVVEIGVHVFVCAHVLACVVEMCACFSMHGDNVFPFQILLNSVSDLAQFRFAFLKFHFKVNFYHFQWR